MADDQVKYSDLIADDVVKGLELLNNALQDIKTTMAGVKEEAASLGVSLKNVSTATREQQQATAQNAASAERLSRRMKDLNEEERKVEEIKRRYKKLTDEQIQAVNAFQQALRGNTAQQMAALNAIDVETKSYNELNAMYNVLKDSLNAMTLAERQNTEAGKAMTAQSAKIYDTMNELQKATGKYTLQVGKYGAAFDGLGYSFQQILREAPSALNINQFFLAISNNIPQFLDQLKAFKNEQAEIKANLANMTEGTAEYAEQLGKVETVGKKLGKVLVSWQSLVLVGLMILRNWDRIVSGITSLFSNLSKEHKMLKAVNEEAASSIGEMTAKFVALQKEWKNLKAENQGEWLKQHQNDWNELGISIDNANDAENLYVQNTSIIQKAIDDRARSIAAMKLAAEKYEEAFRKQVEAEQGLKYRNTSLGSRIVRSWASVGMTEGTGYMTPEQIASQRGAEDEAMKALYNKRMADVERIKKEAQDLITTFALPSVGGRTNRGSKPTTPKDQVDDLLTLQRQLEDAIIANIEDEYKREEAAEIARHTRFLEDREAELKKLKEDDPRRAIINKQIEEEQETHSNNMLDIDEKYRQELIKQSEEEEKLREKNAKESAQRTLKAMADGWQEERAQLVAQGKSRKELIDAELEAEIARLETMLELNRTVNGEIMSDEEKAKVKEWINLLDQIWAKGDFSNIKPGQVFGKGAANITSDKKNWSNIAEVMRDVLDVNITNEQISALNSVFDQAKAALNSWMDARKAAADQAKELADDEVSAAENALNREIELRNQGYANDVALREKELANAKEQQKKAAEEQKKIAQQQILLDAALQASSMITASANIIKQFPNPLAWGPMLAVMWGAYSYAKLKAYQEAGNVKLYREGGSMLLEGGSHQSGHDVNLGIGPDGSNLRAEGGEYFAVINKRNSRKYGSEIPAVVNALNSGMFEDRYIKTSDAVGLLPRVVATDNGHNVDLSAVESGVGQLVKQGESRWTVEGEYRVERYKNRVRRVRVNG